MTSFLNPLNKLEAVDNTTTECDPTTVIDVDNMFYKDYIDQKMTSMNSRIAICQIYISYCAYLTSWD